MENFEIPIEQQKIGKMNFAQYFLTIIVISVKHFFFIFEQSYAIKEDVILSQSPTPNVKKYMCISQK